MSTTAYGPQTSYMSQIIQSNIEYTTYAQIKLLGFFKSLPGGIKNIGKGIEKHIFTQIQKMEPGEVVSDLSALPTNAPRFSETTTSLLTLGTRLSIPKMVMDRWANNNLVKVQLQQVVNEQMKAMGVQIEQFLAWGDSFKNPHTDDRNAGQSFATGLFNSGTTFGGGDGADNDMTAAGDYLSTVSNGVKALKNAGHEGSKYWIFSDVDTYHQATLGVHQLKSTVFDDELNNILGKDKPYKVAAWLDSPNFIDSTGAKYRMVITNPFINPNPETNESMPAYRLLNGYNMELTPLYNGGLSAAGTYDWIILWSGALEIISATALQNTGDLTLT